MAPAQYTSHGRHSAKVICVIMLSVGSPMGSDTHKQLGQRGGDMRHFRMRIEPLDIAFQATGGVWSLPSLPSSLSIQASATLAANEIFQLWYFPQRPHTCCLPQMLAAWPLLTFSLNSYVSSSEMPSLVRTAFEGRG